MNNLDNNLQLIASAKTIKGTSFIGIRNYENKDGEVSNQTIIAGVTYEKTLQNDFNSLVENKETIFAKLENEYPIALIETAYQNVYDSLNKRLSSPEIKEALRQQNDKTILQSDAQLNAYVNVTKGVKINKETAQLHIFGLVVKKTVITPIEYKETKSRELTIVQNKIKKLANFKQSKYRNFIFNMGDVKLQGIEINQK